MYRFLMKVVIDYPSDDDEAKILRLVRGEEGPAKTEPRPKVPQKAVLDARAEVSAVFLSEAVEKYIVALIAATRRPKSFKSDLAKWVQIGASPRGTLALDRCSRAFAWLQARDHVTPDDVRAVAPECLRHRVMLSYEAAADGVAVDRVVAEVIKVVAVG
jgi:MoxR-like ATPase